MLTPKKPEFFLEDIYDIQEMKSLQERVQKTDFLSKFQHRLILLRAAAGVGCREPCWLLLRGSIKWALRYVLK